ncbi:hypothetical protein HK098_006782 [Nowakowskiella sp. JEL0407]|nr:hypothetical protein HK098_006782 [Nowakowskiella sp. JEL0407]
MQFRGRPPILIVLLLAAILLSVYYFRNHSDPKYPVKSNFNQKTIHTETIKSLFSKHEISTSAEGYLKLRENSESPFDYIADAYREQAHFCKLLPALESSKLKIVKITSLRHANAEFDMAIYNGSDYVSENIEKGGWELHLINMIYQKMEFVSKVLGKKAVFMDIGANIGWHSLSVAGAGYPVISFEPMPQNLHLFRWSLCLNENMKIEVFSKGLGEKRDECRIISVGVNVGNGNVQCLEKGQKNLPPISNGWKERGKISVYRLDEVMNERFAASNSGAQRIGVLKVDVEGFELPVFKGGIKFLKTAKIPYMALEFGQAKNRVTEAIDFLTLLDDIDYEVRVGPNRVGVTWENGKILERKNIATFVNITTKAHPYADVVAILKEWIQEHPEEKGKHGVWKP